MVFVMMKPMLKFAILMVETAVEPALIQSIVLNVSASVKTLVLLMPFWVMASVRIK